MTTKRTTNRAGRHNSVLPKLGVLGGSRPAQNGPSGRLPGRTALPGAGPGIDGGPRKKPNAANRVPGLKRPRLTGPGRKAGRQAARKAVSPYRRVYALEILRPDWRYSQYFPLAGVLFTCGAKPVAYGFRAAIQAVAGPDYSPLSTVGEMPLTEVLD